MIATREIFTGVILRFSSPAGNLKAGGGWDLLTLCPLCGWHGFSHFHGSFPHNAVQDMTATSLAMPRTGFPTLRVLAFAITSDGAACEGDGGGTLACLSPLSRSGGGGTLDTDTALRCSPA
ncbi:unspecified product [Leishmania tarentolae]|uniref:Unspecified product n=1 Tax=Leishmania tarentolae TaxID=5689 RepID=A0A640KU96_LEITA|nr:unspecified product [Leishmania tarentolae]